MSGSVSSNYETAGEIRESAILTGDYVVVKTWGEASGEGRRDIDAAHLLLDYTFVIGSLTSMSMKVEYSDDGVVWFQNTSESTSAGVSTVSAQTFKITANATASLSVSLIKHPWLRVSVVGEGTVTSSLLAISARFIS